MKDEALWTNRSCRPERHLTREQCRKRIAPERLYTVFEKRFGETMIRRVDPCGARLRVVQRHTNRHPAFTVTKLPAGRGGRLVSERCLNIGFIEIEAVAGGFMLNSAQEAVAVRNGPQLFPQDGIRMDQIREF